MGKIHFSKHLYIILLLAVFVTISNGQDIQFSQYYNVTPYVNPAFVGSTPVLRAMVHGRWQWMGQDARYFSDYISADYNWQKYNSGLGVYFVSDNQARGIIHSKELALQYVYYFDIAKNITLRFGAQAAYNNRKVDVKKLSFPSQFNGEGFDETIEVADKNTSTPSSFADIAAGAFLYSKRFWIGYAPYHLNRPNRSILNQTERLDVRHEFTMGYKFPIKLHGNKPMAVGVTDDAMAITPTIHYKSQGRSDQLDLGLFLTYYQVLFGLWYRGMPLVKDYDRTVLNNESVVANLGIRYDQWAISYSYDLVVSRQFAYSKGAHELNITFYWPKRSKMKQNSTYKPIPCPSNS